MPRFKFVDRGFKKSILLIPGWATDWRIFEKLDIPFNYLLPEEVLPGDFEKVFNRLPDKIKSPGINLLGWSMGGFIAADLVSIYPSIFDKVILVSIRRRYDRNDIEHIRDYVRRSAKAYLYRFYGELFCDDEEEHKVWFKDSLLKKYTDGLEALHLSDGLDYLANAGLRIDLLNNPNVILVHGEDDRIAPLEGVISIAAHMPRAKFIPIKGARHLPFLREEFRDIFLDKSICWIKRS